MLPYIFIGLAVVFFAIYFITKRSGPSSKFQSKQNPKNVEVKPKINYGKMRIFYGSQTGTAAKISEQLAEQGAEEGFQTEVIDLKEVKIQHFEGVNQISVFMLSNTGEGDPPQNCVRFMKIIKGKQSFDQVKVLDWSKVNYTVFGLGNTQYEHYNVTGINTDDFLHKLGAKRIFKLGLGDDNCSLEDDCNAWKKQLWPALKKFRQQNPLGKASAEHEAVRVVNQELQSGQQYVSKQQPLYANYKIFVSNNREFAHRQWEYDFKTKASLKAEIAAIHNIRQLRQNQNDGSTLQMEVQLSTSPEYQTAGNIALYSKNDPKILKEVIEYFDLKETDLDKKIGLKLINQEKKNKLNFVPNTLRTLLEESIDLQCKISKSLLKKLAKFESANQSYFLENSSPKTTEQYKRITEQTDEGHWYYPIKIIKQNQVKLSLEDFIQLSDSMAPRLFTIASHSKTQKNPIVAASIVGNGLISKFFLEQPNQLRAEFRKSTFNDAMKWKKVIFVAAGTGLAPFRAYIQEKIFKLKLKQQGKQFNTPIISLFFGCKHEHGDFIYKDQILAWRDQGIIQRLHLAFSRDTNRKVYVQHLLQKQEAELNELGHCNETAIYICGSLPMGNTIAQILNNRFGVEAVKKMEQEGRIVKQLW